MQSMISPVTTSGTSSLLGPLQQTTQMAMLAKFSTGNPIIDPLIHMALYSIITVVLLNLQKICDMSNITYYLGFITRGVSYYYYKLFKKEPDTIDKTITIEYISDNKKINNLYIAVDWYLSTMMNTDLIKESPLKFTFEQDLDTLTLESFAQSTATQINTTQDSQTKSKSSSSQSNTQLNIKLNTQLNTQANTSLINKKITSNRYKSIIYKTYEILYLLNTNLITVYSDVERKRENYTITLSTKIKKTATQDILEDFANFCLQEYVKSKQSKTWKQLIYVNNSENKWVSSESNNKRHINTVILKDDLIPQIKEELTSFIDSEEWYRERGIPYTFGYLLYGEPGTGKTSLINGISNFTQRHLHYLMLNNVKSDNDLLDLLKDIKYKETILIIEDIDAMTDIVGDRSSKQANLININANAIIQDKNQDKLDQVASKLEKIIENNLDQNNLNLNLNQPRSHKSAGASSSSLTLSGVLNGLDGVFNNDGRIMIMTTNHLELLDPALIRSGRISRKIHFDHCNKQQAADIYKMMFNETIDPKLITLPDKSYSTADITGLFLRYRKNPKDVFNNLDKIEKTLVFNNNKSLARELAASSKTSKNNRDY